MIRIKARWNDAETQRLADLGLDPPNYYFKEVYINPSLITAIDEYEGYCCIYFSDVDSGTVLITNIPWADIEGLLKHIPK